jgi:hypothetical protein
MLDATVVRTISAITYPIRHQFARLAPDIGGADSDLDQYGGANAHILVTGLAERRFSSHNDHFDYSSLVGKVVAVRPSRPDGREWYLSEDTNPDGAAYLTGARVSPTPVNGRLYQELRDLPGEMHSSPFVLRFNDEAHRDDRANRDNPWTIVWGQDGLEHNAGAARVQAPLAWVEVQSPLSPVTTGLASDEEIDLILSDEEVPVPAPVGFITNGVIGHTLGKAQAEADGNVILDPVRVPGELYLTWYEGTNWYDDHVMVQVAISETHMAPVGYYNRGVDNAVYYHDDIYYEVRGPAWAAPTDIHWAKLGLESPDPATDADIRVSNLLTIAEESHESFENLNDALNELAEDEGWCSEYERTMQSIQMRDRRSGPRAPFDRGNIGAPPRPDRHAYDIQYDVEVTVTDDSPGYRITNAIESEHGLAGVSELRFDATLTVTISGVVAEDEDSAENMVSQSQITDEVESMLSDVEFELNDYSHSDTSEDTDFDWEEYDDNQ